MSDATPIFKTPPTELCLHKFASAIDLVRKKSWLECVICGKKLNYTRGPIAKLSSKDEVSK